ncbi:MAG: TolC family protein [Gammaproteobacteria bacterium]|nr:TolC family protein [Gammaproteobacteria bacterium]
MYKRFSIVALLSGCMLFIPVPAISTETSVAPLANFVAQVIDNHPRIRSMDAALKASSARYQAADQALYNPELEFDTERTDINTTSLGISQTIDWSDKRGARAKTAQQTYNANAADANSLRQQLARNLLNALSEYNTADTLNRLGQQSLQLMQQFVDIAEQRLQAGDLNQVELDLAKLAALEADLESSELAARLSDAEQALFSLLGDRPAPRVWPGLPQTLPVIQSDRLDIEDLIKTHPVFQAKQAQINAARALVSLRQREAKPDPTIGIRAGREDNNTLTGLTLSLPLFVRNTYQAEVTEAHAQLTQTEFDARSTWLDLKNRILTARQRYILTRNTWTNWQQRGTSSIKRRIDLLKQLWQVGELSSTDYLIQLKQTLDTQSAGIELRGRLWHNWSNWLMASASIFQWLEIDERTSSTDIQH